MNEPSSILSLSPSRKAEILQEGSLLQDAHRQDAYRVIRHLGSGRLSEVYAACEQGTQKEFAVKVFRKKALQDPHFLGKLTSLLPQLTGLSHKSLPKIHTHYLTPGLSYLVMDWIVGTPLRAMLGEPMEETKARTLYHPIADLLSELHGDGLFHGSLWPGNVLVCAKEDGNQEIKVLGLGMSELAPALKEPPDLLQLAYLAPEIFHLRADRKASLGPLADQFSLGAIIYQMLRGVPAFFEPMDNAKDIERRVLREDPRPLYAPRAQREALFTSMHKLPHLRHRSLAEFVEALEETSPEQRDTILDTSQRFTLPLPPVLPATRGWAGYLPVAKGWVILCSLLVASLLVLGLVLVRVVSTPDPTPPKETERPRPTIPTAKVLQIAPAHQPPKKPAQQPNPPAVQVKSPPELTPPLRPPDGVPVKPQPTPPVKPQPAPPQRPVEFAGAATAKQQQYILKHCFPGGPPRAFSVKLVSTGKEWMKASASGIEDATVDCFKKAPLAQAEQVLIIKR